MATAQHNAKVMNRFDLTKRLTAKPMYAELHRDALAVLNSTSRIPEVSAHGEFLYNLWQDETHPRGLYRRTTLEELRKENPEWDDLYWGLAPG